MKPISEPIRNHGKQEVYLSIISHNYWITALSDHSNPRVSLKPWAIVRSSEQSPPHSQSTIFYGAIYYNFLTR